MAPLIFVHVPVAKGGGSLTAPESAGTYFESNRNFAAPAWFIPIRDETPLF